MANYEGVGGSRRFWIRAAIAGVVIAALGALMSQSLGGTDTTAVNACGRFNTVAVDVVDGVLTDDELRQRMRGVANRAVGSAVEDEARRVLAAITSGTQSEVNAAVRAMTAACDDHR